jgi:hypothetical protein
VTTNLSEVEVMRLSPVVAAALILSLSGTAFAQEYVEYVSRKDNFTITFPMEPKVTETTFKSQFGGVLPARVYSADLGPGRQFSVTVVDYNDIQAIDTAKSKACPAGAETCIGGLGAGSSTGAGYWKPDIEGAVMYATWLYLQRDAKVTFVSWTNMDLVEGNLVALQNNKDGSRTSAGIYMHQNKLYMIEGTAPKGYPVPDFFQQSVGWIDDNGMPIRYLTIYHNGFPTPEIARRGGQGQGGGQAPGAAGQAQGQRGGGANGGQPR